MTNSDQKEPQEARGCPDGGACHHTCHRVCFRVHGCGPLSGVYPGDRWPDDVKRLHIDENDTENRGMRKSLGNAKPTDDERRRMVALLAALRDRLQARATHLTPPEINEQDGTVGLRWDGLSGPPCVEAWVSPFGRQLLVWRHPSLRFGADDVFLFEWREANPT